MSNTTGHLTSTANKERLAREYKDARTDSRVRAASTFSPQTSPVRTIVAPSGIKSVKFTLTTRSGGAPAGVSDTKTP